MASGEHEYHVSVEWIGNQGSGTSGYREYGRNHEIRVEGKPTIPGSADPAFRGDAARWNPEDLLVASASACHKLWYLHLCAEAGVVVEQYRDDAVGTMIDTAGEGRFTRIVLRPQVTIRSGGNADLVTLAQALHHAAHEKCYIANSVNFPIECEPVVDVVEA
ncbi:OsmC family protein [Pandoraea sp. NPDC087047]|uniref:OsmC family protein n=1 Tax=Pandoraea sp. NPDC087047 TaxID=3364390 RepID=UPI00380AA1B2